ncbi:unnamed protein product [Miscanthus lutarioriparius]|uniref:Uncharacterized protein n=1 Tax=Miscanthus lutarioriparius TaxID=422564 RepID=A0A811SJN5_9POAL|nr:unnamed protein product [Miscanthus lutarioriparius]
MASVVMFRSTRSCKNYWFRGNGIGCGGGNMEVDEVGLEQVPDVIQNYHICAVKNRRIDSDIIAKAIQMKIIMQYGVGLEGVDVNAATEHKIKVARIPGSMTGNAVSCAEMAIYLTLGVLRKQKLMDAAVHQKGLGSPTGRTILGKTVLILGFGAIGVEIAKRLKPFGVKILATKKKLVMRLIAMWVRVWSILLEEAFWTTRLCSITLSQPFDPEDPILKFSNVIITPHVAGVTEYSYRTMAKVVGDVALQLHSGETFTGIEFVN